MRVQMASPTATSVAAGIPILRHWRTLGRPLMALGLLLGAVLLDAEAQAAPVAAAVSDASGGLILNFERGPPVDSGADTSMDEATADAQARAAVVRLAGRGGLKLVFQRRLGTGSVLVQAPGDEAERMALAQHLMRLPNSGLHYAQADLLAQAVALPNDTDAANLWGLAGPPEGSVAGVNAYSAWPVSTGSGAVAAIIDTGYRPHVDLAAHVLGGYDFISDSFNANDGGGRDADASDPGDWKNAGECGATSFKASSWHGTHVAGTVSAVTNNSQGVAGVAPGAMLLIARALGKCGGYTSDISDAIVWSSGGTVSGVPVNANPAGVINMSLGASAPCSSTPEFQTAINSARSRNTVVVVAAGNSAMDAASFSPASCTGVVTVAAVGQTGGRAYYSNYGSVVDVAGPGGDQSYGSIYGIESTLNTGTTTPGADSYVWYQGTSMATPHVAGVAALMKGLAPTLTPDAIESALKSSVRAFPASCSGCGAGLVDAAQALSAVIGGTATPLTKAVPITGITGTAGSTRMYVLSVPNYAINLDIQLTAGSGTAELYVKRGAIPTTSSYDCYGASNGSGAACSFSGAVTAGTWYVMVRGVSDYSGYSLVADYALNLPGALAFTASTYNVGEAVGSATITVSRSGGSNGAVAVTYATSNGTATSGSDYTGKTGTLSWAAGDTADKTFTVTIANDTAAEPAETVNLTLSAATNGATLGSPATAQIAIADNDSDPGVLAFAVSAYAVTEGTATVTLSVARTGGKYGAVGVSYGLANGGTATAGGDFTTPSGTLSWANGDTANKSIVVTITNDAIAEAAETLIVALSSPTGGATLGALTSATVTINDNDGAPGSLAFTASAFSAAEDAGTALVTVGRTGGSGGAVTVNYISSNGTATAGSDYTAVSGTLSWAASDPYPKTIAVPVNNDAAWESNETVTLTLSTPTGGATLGSQKTATLTITDNDNNGGTLAFSAANYTVAEGTSTVTLTVTRTGGNAGAVSVSYATADGTATATNDYTAKTGTLSWAAGDSAAKTFTVTITNDAVAESTETFGLVLSSPTGGATLGAQSSSTVTVSDNDTAPGALAFSAASYSLAETGGSATITVTRTGGSGGAVTVTYAAVSGTATAGADFTAVSGSLSWAAGDPAAKTFTVPVTDDSVWESTETVSLSLSSPSGGATLGSQKTATLSITDNDNNPGVLAFSTSGYTVAESTASVSITVNRTGGNSGAVSVSYATANGSATAGSDYTAKTGTLSWANGDSAAKTFTVSITNDLVAEQAETINLSLGAPTGGASLGSVSAASISITDNDTAPGTLAFSTASYSAAENAGYATITVTRTGGSGGAVSVAYATATGTATAASDFTTTSGTLSWEAGDPAAKTFTIPIIDDTVWEPAETVSLSLSSPSGGATLGTQKTATLSITDNDNSPGLLSFSAASYTVAESSATVTLTVTRTGGNAGSVGLSYATANGSATAGSDYTAKTGTLSWASGDSASKTFTVTIANDLYSEITETFAANLSNPSGGASLGATPSSTVSITDNDGAPGSLAFSASGYTVAESGGSVLLTVTRSGGSGGAVSVQYLISGGTATAAADYASVSGTLSWDDSDPASKTFSIPVLEDSVWEPSESIALTLASPSGGATLGSQKTGTVTITDNDNNPGSLAFSLGSYTVTEGTSTVTIYVTRTGGNAGTVGVSYATVANGSATAGSDFTSKSGTLSWSSGDSANRSFTVTIANDTLKESPETFGLSLNNATGGAVIGAQSTATVTINDND